QPAELATSLESALGDAVPDGCTVTVGVDHIHDAAATDPSAPIVRAACGLWEREFGRPAELTGWTGSTDGVVLRGAGIDTVRLGPQAARSSLDPRRDVLRLDQLDRFVRMYRELLEVA